MEIANCEETGNAGEANEGDTGNVEGEKETS